ncbi:C39 family peptidase [Ligilactobacillus ruminis]|uniref:C39 family peptidase n=1 Tax=Ligilactobacillus ruminis TaxID=1623 RepID=UPI0022DEC557|nr:C39 family peptidase [Ligilactobacillus ruminis]
MAIWKYNPGNIVDQAAELLNIEDAKSAVKVVHKKRVVLNVPLINQMDDPKLYNGCEVTSLAMVLNYNGIDVTKSELADNIETVPFQYDNGEHGNPNDGFVGSVSGSTSTGLGVYHGPIYKLAKQYADNVYDLTGSNFDTVVNKVEEGHPVWTITTTAFAPVSDFESWDTPDGEIDVTYSEHSVCITGFDRDKRVIYVNDPYGYKNREVDWNDFAAAYKQMGKQAVYVTK